MESGTRAVPKAGPRHNHMVQGVLQWLLDMPLELSGMHAALSMPKLVGAISLRLPMLLGKKFVKLFPGIFRWPPFVLCVLPDAIFVSMVLMLIFAEVSGHRLCCEWQA